MGRKLSKILNVIDLETTAWEKETDKPEGEIQDIIEVGIVELSIATNMPEIISKRSYLVIPQRSTISEFCTALTTITPEMITNMATDFGFVLKTLSKAYKSKDRVWASWGDFDRKMFERQCSDLKLPYPFGPRHINLKCLYSVMNHLEYELGMPAALEHCGMPLEGTHHRGHDDAYNIAKIAQLLLRKA